MGLVLFAVIGGIYLGVGAGQGSPVKQDVASAGDATGTPDMGASAQMELMTGKTALGGSSAVVPAADAGGAIVAPGGIELQRKDPEPAAVPAAEDPVSAASVPVGGAVGEEPVAGTMAPPPEELLSAVHPASAPASR